MIRHITVLGSTGSIGQSTLDVVRRHPDRYRVFALSAARSVDTMLSDIAEFAPRYVVMADAAAAAGLTAQLAAGCQTEVLTGADALAMIASRTRIE